MLTDNTNVELFICKGCKLTRPVVWWESLELDIDTKIIWPTQETPSNPEAAVPEELTGIQEAPWGD